MDGLDLPPGPVEVAREDEQLEQEQPLALVDGVGFDLPDLGVDGLLQLSRSEKLSSVH